MTANRPTFDDSLLRRALAELADGPDTDELVHEVLRTVAATPQVGRVSQPWMSRKLTLLLAAGLLLVASVAAAIAGGLLPRPRPSPLSMSGPIAVLSESGELVGIDPVTGDDAELGTFSMPSGFGVDGPATLGPNRDTDVIRQSAYTAWSPDDLRLARYGHVSTGVAASGLSVWVRERGAGAGEAVMVADLGSCQCVASYGLAWSPDSTHLAIVKPDQGPDADDVRAGLYVVNADGTGLRLLREGSWGRPVWLLPVTGPSPPANSPSAAPSSEATRAIATIRPRFTYAIPTDSDLRLVEESNVLRFQARDRGVLVFGVASDLVVHACAVNHESSGRTAVTGTPEELFDGLWEIGGIGIGPVSATTLDGRRAATARVDPSAHRCGEADIHLGSQGLSAFVELNDPAQLILAEVEGRIVGVQIWTFNPDDLDAWIPTAMQFVDSIDFDGTSPP